MGSCPEYICIWLGLAKLGVVTSLINHNLRNQPLSHTLNVAKTKAVIFSHELSSGGWHCKQQPFRDRSPIISFSFQVVHDDMQYQNLFSKYKWAFLKQINTSLVDLMHKIYIKFCEHFASWMRSFWVNYIRKYWHLFSTENLLPISSGKIIVYLK
jgi:hypothetical protein